MHKSTATDGGGKKGGQTGQLRDETRRGGRRRRRQILAAITERGKEEKGIRYNAGVLVFFWSKGAS